MNGFDAFVASLRDAAPSGDASPALRGVWHALRGDWEAAHDAVQSDDPACAWVHAALHREEGDLANADCWYARAGRRRAAGATRAEFLQIAAALLAPPP